MSEQNLDVVVEMIKNDDYKGEVFKLANPNERIAWLLYYLMDDKKTVLYECIKQKTDDERKKIFKSLVGLYPLSRNIILYMFLNHAEEADLDDFIEAYDLDEMVLNELERTVSDMMDGSDQISRTIREYKEKIVKMENDIKEKEKELKERKEDRKKLSELDSKIVELDKEIKEVSKSAEELQIEIKEKQTELDNKKRVKNTRKKTLEKINKEIKELDVMTNSEAEKMPAKYQKVLGSIQKAMKDFEE